MLAVMWRWLGALLALGLILAAVGAGLAGLLRRVPAVRLVAADARGRSPARSLRLRWPATGEAAVVVPGVGVLGSRHGDRTVPIASVAKVMTAYVVLRDHPLGRDAGGPVISVTRADVAVYRADLALGESVARVRAGEELSERQALEAMLLPSANNIATLLAEWDAGSLAAFVAKLNDQARALGLRHTSYADASGFDQATESSAADQARLATLALRVPAFAQIVSMPQVSLPVAGVKRNLNALLGRDGVFGVKTGSTSAAGGCLVFASRERVGVHVVTVVGAVLGQPATRAQPTFVGAAVDASAKLLRSVRRSLEVVRLAPATPLASLRARWTQPVPAAPARPVSFVAWPGLPVRIRITAEPRLRAPMSAGQPVATVQLIVGKQHATVPVLATRRFPSPSFWWRVTHP
jgi:D-alanyl-D-alanine carboxypeptidase (penicillin-binding protein 5/6)